MNDDLRDRAAEFLHAYATAEYRVRLGQAPPSEQTAVLDRFARLFNAEAVTEAQRSLAGATGEEERSGRFLLALLVDGRSALASAPEREQLRLWESAANVALGERQVPFAAVPELLANTPEPALRASIGEARLAGLFDTEPLLERVLHIEHEVVGDLGHGSYLEAREVLDGIDLRALSREAGTFLADTEAFYRDLLARYLPRLADVAPAEATWADLPRLLRAAPYDDLFRASELVPRLRSTLGAMELDPGALLWEPQTPRTFCQPLRIPGEVALAVASRAGFGGHERGLHELGVALGHAHTAPELPLEFRWLGDASISLAYGLLFAGLLGTPSWVRRARGLSRAERDEYLRLAALLRLVALRRHAGQLQFELELHDESSLGGKSQRFAEILTEATGFRHHPRAYLWEAHPGIPSARHLRAAQLHALLADHLRTRFDEDWFRNPGTGPALLALFASGRRYTAPELATQLASRPLSFDPVREHFEELA